MIEEVTGKSHLVIKRDGRVEPYSSDKLKAVILWASDGSESFTSSLLDAVDIKIHNKIRIDKLYDEVINTASNMISDMYPQWEIIAKNLYLLKLHKDIGVKRTEYPEYLEVVRRNIRGGFYDPELLMQVDIEALGEAIDINYDKLFTFGGLNLFVDKYCNKQEDKLLELPQHVYMRVAIQEMYKDGTQRIIEKYKQLATHDVTEATPKMVNSIKKNPQLFSCCLARPEDNLESINEVDNILGKESKFGGGLATDFSAIRTKGAKVEGNKGKSGGIVPFIQKNQWSVGAYNQGSTRSSSECMYYNWFHYESPEITMLKDKSGKDEERARKLKYAIKWNKTFSDAIRSNDDIWLFDPHKTQDMTYAYGEEFKELYTKYSTSKVRKRKYSARDLAMTVAKIKVETGNNYTYFHDNANLQNIGGGVITQSNLCVEYLPNFTPITYKASELVDGEVHYKFSGDIALCNLSSLNLAEWVKKSTSEKQHTMSILVRSMDNCIDNSFYSNKYGEHHSTQHRNLGIGVSNYANVLATKGFLWDSKEARKYTHELFEEISYMAIKASVLLAKERGVFPLYTNTKWSQGIFPHELSILSKLDRSDLNFELTCDWESLREMLKLYGIRNEYLLAVAPTATSGLCINATPGVDTPRKLKVIQDGTYSLPFVAPNLKANREFYRTTFEIANKDTIELAAIRQKFIDMGQSVSLAYKDPDSAYEVISDIIYAEELGLKTLYYTNTPAADDLAEEVCENCSS